MIPETGPGMAGLAVLTVALSAAQGHPGLI